MCSEYTKKCIKCFWYKQCGLAVKREDCEQFVTKAQLQNKGLYPKESSLNEKV